MSQDRPKTAPRRSYFGSFVASFLASIFGRFLVRFWCHLGGLWGGFWAPKSVMLGSFFGVFCFFFRVVFLLVCWSFWGAFWERFWNQNRDKVDPRWSKLGSRRLLKRYFLKNVNFHETSAGVMSGAFPGPQDSTQKTQDRPKTGPRSSWMGFFAS